MYSVEEKLEIVKRLLSGESVWSIRRKTGINSDAIYLWRLRYEKYGIKGLEYYPRKGRYPEEKKLSVVRDFYENDLTLLQIANKYDISRQVARTWVNKYNPHAQQQEPQEEVEPKEAYTIMTEELKKKVSSELSFLKDESLSQEKKMKMVEEKFLYAQAETAYLKKVRALVQEEKAQRLKQGYESSKN